jgi:GxxExxY protein
MLNVRTPLDETTERLASRVIGCCIKVHQVLGPGLLEGIYGRAMELELTAHDISVERERRVPVMYRGQMLCSQRIDLLVEGCLVL